MIIVFGSLNMDMAIELEKLPEPGETVLSDGYDLIPGGKGANQALAAARAGARVAMVGRVGLDNYGRTCTEALKREGVMVSGVAKSDNPTGTAVVARGKSHGGVKGENMIIVMSGANADVTHDQVPDDILTKNNMLLMQMELPVEQTVTLIERAHKLGCKTILNLAPAIMVPKKALGNLDYLIVNSIEARQIAEKLGLAVENNAIKLAQALAMSGNLTCIVTLGGKGSVCVTREGKAWGVPTIQLKPEEVVDTTGAGDAYCGTFAAAIHAGLDVTEAMRRGSVAGAMACMKAGAQESLPFIADVEEQLAKVGPAEPLKL